MFKIILDRPGSLVFVRIRGFLEADDVASIIAETRKAGQSLGAGARPYDLLCDLTDTKVGSLAASDRFRDLINDDSTQHLWARRVAYVTPSALLRLQITPACARRPDIRIFDARRPALAWLQAERAIASIDSPR